MLKRFKTLTLTLAVLGAAVAMNPAHAAGKRLVIAKISTNAGKQLPRLRAMGDALADALKRSGIEGVDVRVLSSERAAERAMRNGEIDMLSETVFAALSLERAGVGEIALAEWKGGQRQYHTVIFAKKGSPKGLASLRGKKIAFQESGSTSGYYLPRYTMQQQGYKLVPDSRESSGDAVRYIFAGEDEINVVVAVARGQADAGTLSNLDWEDADTVPPALKKRLEIIHETAPILRSVTVLRKDMDPAVKRRLVEVLEGMGDDRSAQKTLKTYYKVKKFQRIGPEEETILAGARELIRTGS